VSPVALFSSTWQLVVVLLILLLLFGSRLPRIARSLGEGITEFKKGLNKGSNGSNGDDDASEERRRLPDADDRRATSAKRTDVDDSTP
jgi:TatA/E family protein of Tat protein translocase